MGMRERKGKATGAYYIKRTSIFVKKPAWYCWGNKNHGAYDGLAM
jgi:hypothetical protein